MIGNSQIGNTLFGGSFPDSFTEGETKEAIKNKLIKYLPSFIDLNSVILNIILNAVSLSMMYLYIGIYTKLRNLFWIGKGLRLFADANKIFYLNNETDISLQSKVTYKEDILSERGTEKGIINDIECFQELIGSEVEFLLADNEWILDLNYPDIVPKMNFLDTYKLIKLNLGLQSKLGTAILGEAIMGELVSKKVMKIRPKIEKYIIPIDTAIVYE
jgi:hypothetical protein